MKSIYIDTSVILAKYKPNDNIHGDAKIMFKSKKLKHIISHITLIELASVISRNFKQIKIGDLASKELLDFTFREKVYFLLRYILEENLLNIFHYNGKDSIPYFEALESIFSDYSQAIFLAPISKLRTLDNLHIASLKNIIFSKNLSINYFVTGDEEILKNRNKLKSYLDLLIVSPQTLIELEAL